MDTTGTLRSYESEYLRHSSLPNSSFPARPPPRHRVALQGNHSEFWCGKIRTVIPDVYLGVAVVSIVEISHLLGSRSQGRYTKGIIY